jgi:chaperonin cofactor prefoldin
MKVLRKIVAYCAIHSPAMYNDSTQNNPQSIEALQAEIDALRERQQLLQKQLEERQEMMQNLFSFVTANAKK